MSDNQINSKPQGNELDLLELSRRIGKRLGNMFRAIGRGTLITTVFLLKKWLPLSLSIITGILISYALKLASSSFYTSDITIRSNAVPNSDIVSYIDKLHVFCREGNKAALANALSLDSAQVNNIKDIKALWIIDMGRDGIPDFIDIKGKHNVYDTVNVRMQDRLAIRVKISTPQELSSLRDGLFKYISNDSLFRQKNRVRLKQSDELIARLNYDIEQLDSLQEVKYFEETRRNIPPSGGQMIFMQTPNTQLLYSDIYELYRRKQAAESERALYSNLITLLSDFTVPFRPENSTMYYGKKIIPAIFFLAVIIILMWDNRKKLMDVYNKY
jgi:hypothetical protein